MPRKVRELISDLTRAGFEKKPGGKGSHRKFVHSKVKDCIVLSGKEGDDAKKYQEKDVKEAIEEASR